MTVRVAGARFIANYEGVAKPSTIRKYQTKVKLLVNFLERVRVPLLADVTVDWLERYRSSRVVSKVTWRVELQALRTFFSFCHERGWIVANPASQVRSPRGIPERMLAACDRIGGTKYERTAAPNERRRAWTIIMLLHCTALRIKDIALLRRDSVLLAESGQIARILLRTQKSGEPVFLPIPVELERALRALPLPEGASADCPYSYWNGTSSERAALGVIERASGAVFEESGVRHAHAHRFRHTLATRLLGPARVTS